jgi:hypothetical protein
MSSTEVVNRIIAIQVVFAVVVVASAYIFKFSTFYFLRNWYTQAENYPHTGTVDVNENTFPCFYYDEFDEKNESSTNTVASDSVTLRSLSDLSLVDLQKINRDKFGYNEGTISHLRDSKLVHQECADSAAEDKSEAWFKVFLQYAFGIGYLLMIANWARKHI